MAQRNTWQRERVREALADARGFVSAQSLHATLRDDNTGIGLATVYRVLQQFEQAGQRTAMFMKEVKDLGLLAGEALSVMRGNRALPAHRPWHVAGGRAPG